MQKISAQPHLPGTGLYPHPLLAMPHGRRLAKAVRRISVGTGVVLMSVVALQLVYPANRSLPRTSFGGTDLRYATAEEISSRLADIENKQFTAKTESHTYRQSLGDIGISLDTAKITKNLSDYPLSARLIPFSVLFYQPPTPDNHLMVRDEAKLQAFTAKVAAENNTAPTEGNITNDNGDITITHSKAGRDYRAEDIAHYFSAYTHESLAEEASLPYSSVAPINTHEYLELVAAQAEKLIQTKQTVTHEARSFAIDSDVLARAVTFATQPDKKITVSVDASVLAAGLELAADGVFVAPSAATAGQELDWAQTAALAAKSLQQERTSSAVALKPIAPTSSKVYPATSGGIQQLIIDWKTAHASLKPAISFSEIGGYGRSADVDGDVAYFSASVYKVFPAWYVLKQIDMGKLDPNGPIAGGFNLADCFYNMIHISDSKCSEAIVNKYGGWGPMDKLASDHGITGITLSSGVTITANGMTSFLHKLDKGELLSKEQTDYLLQQMKMQKYRTGFPAGSDGEVANKVGYQPKTKSWHDAGIIYHPKGTYTLVALTHEGASLPTLATLARQISDTLSR